jgi:hypothetical protein
MRSRSTRSRRNGHTTSAQRRRVVSVGDLLRCCNISTDRRCAVVAGVLLIVATVTSLLSGVFLAPIHDSRYFVDVAAHDAQVEVGVLLVCIAALTAPAIAAALYPLIRRFGEGRLSARSPFESSRALTISSARCWSCRW